MRGAVRGAVGGAVEGAVGGALFFVLGMTLRFKRRKENVGIKEGLMNSHNRIYLSSFESGLFY